MNNKNKKPDLQFTKLTSDDIAIHKNIYADLLVSNTGSLPHEKIRALPEAMQLFYNTFK